jgi:hypothetical protein
VADNWSVVCVTGDHPKGAADFDRFARKHDRYFALAQTGDVVSGVAHVDPRLSPYAPPPEDQFDALNATMLRRAGERDGARERWAIGTPFADEPVATVTVATRRPLGLPARAASSLIRRRRRGRTTAVTLVVAVVLAESALFAEALDEVLAPLSQPRYIIPRLILAPPAGSAAAAGLAVRRLVTGHVPATVVYHAVPTALSGHKKLALVFERAWNARVGPGSVVYAGSPEGTGILAAQRGDDPFALTTQIRTLWR